MKDAGRWRISEEIAKHVPYSTDTVYDVYTYVLEQNKKQNCVVMLDKQLHCVKTILQVAVTFQVTPLTVAIMLYEINEKQHEQ